MEADQYRERELEELRRRVREQAVKLDEQARTIATLEAVAEAA